MEEILVIDKNVKEDEIYTSLQGFLEKVKVDNIISVLGEPDYLTEEEGSYSKIDWEWLFKIKGEFISVYNWKDKMTAPEGAIITINDIKDWHIGGKDRQSVDLLKEFFKQKNIECEIHYA